MPPTLCVALEAWVYNLGMQPGSNRGPDFCVVVESWSYTRLNFIISETRLPSGLFFSLDPSQICSL